MKSNTFEMIFGYVVVISIISTAQLVTDPLPYAPIANPLPDTLDQLNRDSVNIKFSPIRINQAGYRPQDKKYFYYVGSGSSFSVINEAGASVGSGTLRSTGQTVSSQLKIRASNNATLVSGGDTRYLMNSPVYSGSISEGLIPDLPSGVYRIVVGTTTSHPFVIDERVYSWVRDALLKFYGVNRCGDSQSWFHPPCHLKDAVTGGWHDCGDHLKEGATMSYAAAVLGLAAAAFFDRDVDVYSANQGITQLTDGIPDILYEAKHGADFILQSYDKAVGQVGSMVTSMGGFGNPGCGDDHSWWGRPEYQDKMPEARGGPPRCARNEPTTDYLGKYAANLAFVSKRIRPYDTAYADRCLKAARAIYDFTKVRLDLTNTAAYNGATIVTDDAAFGCLALLWATGERKYLDELCFSKSIGSKASVNAKLFEGGWFTANDPVFTHTTANTDWASSQAHVLWGFFRLVLSDTVLCTKLNLSSQERLALIEKTVYNLIANLSSVGLGSNSIQLPDNGFWVPPIIKYERPWFTMHTQMEWVWNRYQAGNITEMYYYYDIASKIQGLQLPNTPASANWKADTVKTILVRMLDYMIGVNPWDMSMIYGIGEKNFNHPHHRAANPEGKNVPGAFYKYCPPVGALQGGYKPIAPAEYAEHYDDWMHAETGIDGTTNILMPVIGLAKEDTIQPPFGTVRIIYVGCDEAIVEIRQTRFGNAEIHYGINGGVYTKVVKSDSAGVVHRIVLSGLSQGTMHNFEVLVSDMFGRDSVIKYLTEEKKPVDFTFTTLQNCPTNANIQNVKVCRVTSDSAEIFWFTPNGEFDSKVVYGMQKPPATVQDGDVSGHPAKFHYVKIGGLKEKTTYYFYVESGESRDDNNGELYQFTTPVKHVNFDVRAVRYVWERMPTIGLNVMNQDSARYDSLELRIYVRGPETYTLTRAEFGIPKDTVVRFQDHVMFRVDIGIKYRSDGYQDLHFKTAVDKYVQSARPVRMEDTYDPVTNTWGYYLPVPLGEAIMEPGARFRLDISMLARSPWPPNLDAWTTPSLKEITNADWSFGPHSREKGDPYDYDGVPVMTKEAVDAENFNTPINYYITVYRKGEYVWGYSPSQKEMQTKKTHYSLVSQITTPLNNPTADYLFYTSPIRSVPVSGWASIDPIDGTLNDIWVNGIKQTNINSMFVKNDSDNRYYFTIPVPLPRDQYDVNITLFAGPKATCDSCYGCAVSNHSFFVELQGAKQYPSQLLLRDTTMLPLGDTVKPDTSLFYVIVNDPNGNQKGKAVDVVTVRIKNLDNGDSITVSLAETGDSTGIFQMQTTTPIAVVDKTPAESGPMQIAMNGGDRVRIWYVDPTDSTDSAEAFITSKANFPLARKGWLKDSDGNGSADLMAVEYSIPLKENVDSIRVNFPNATTTVMTRATVDATTFAGNLVTVVFRQPLPDGVTGFSSALYSSGTSYLTSGGLVKASNFTLYDSIGPVLNGQAIVRERPEAGNDTISLSLSEAIKLDNFQGEVLLLRRDNADHPITVLGILSNEPGTNNMTIICNTAGFQFSAGDSLRLNGTSALTDLSQNKPHLSNRAVPVIIKAASARITYAYYLDLDFNGSIDMVKMGFSKQVDPARLNITLRWNDQPATSIENVKITSVAGSSTDISIVIDSQLTQNAIITSGTMTSTVVQKDFPLDTVFSDVADSADPVILSARFTLFNGDISGGTITDTLRIVFSETILPDSAINIRSLNMLCAATGLPYSFNVTSYRMTNQKEYLFFGAATGVPYPVSGDIIWLQPASRVTDFRGNVQLSDLNRRVPVTVDAITMSLKDVTKLIYPNPFNPKIEKLTVKLLPKNARFPVKIDSSARAVIYDKVGNTVADLQSIPTTEGAELLWFGTNRKGRIVGNGTYLCYLYFMGEKEILPVGVMRRE